VAGRRRRRAVRRQGALHVADEVGVRDRRPAAAFERAAFEAGVVAMPEPVLTTAGEGLVLATGSRGRPVGVRVHRWSAGDENPRPAPPPVCAAAGAALAAVQSFGATWRWPAAVSYRDLQPNRGTVEATLAALAGRGMLDGDTARRLGDAVGRALPIVADGLALPGPWTPTHFDLKPANTLWHDSALVVLDWDECRICHPWLEAVATACIWAGGRDRPIDPAPFAAYLDGYGARAGLGPPAFAKLLADLVAWIGYQGRRALGEYPDDLPLERDDALVEAMAAGEELVALLDQLPALCD
jgi:hypothetical protein